MLAHVSNNLVNDLFDTDAGLDAEDYPRALYAPHPILSGMIDRDGLVRAAVAVNVADLVILAILVGARGLVVLAFGVAGVVLNVAYTAPPLRLKKRGLGELDVLLVWGPLMIAGTYYASVGDGAMAGVARIDPVRPLVHRRADGQAHRQAALGRGGRRAHAAGDHRRAPRPPRDRGTDGRLLRRAWSPAC